PATTTSRSTVPAASWCRSLRPGGLSGARCRSSRRGTAPSTPSDRAAIRSTTSRRPPASRRTRAPPRWRDASPGGSPRPSTAPSTAGGDPQYHVEATTRQQEDKDAAEMAGRIARWLAQDLHSHKNRSESAMWKLLAGSCIIACEVDYEEDPDYLATIDPETGEAVIVPKPVIRFEILPPQVVWADDRQSTVEDMRWIGRDIPTTIAEAIARWPEHAALFAPEIGADERGHAVLRRTQRLTSIENPWHERTMEGSGVG